MWQIKRNTRLRDEESSDIQEDEREAKAAKTGSCLAPSALTMLHQGLIFSNCHKHSLEAGVWRLHVCLCRARGA